MFVANNGTWSQQAQIEGTGLGLGTVYGDSVAISGTGDTITVGAPGKTRAYLFKNAGGNWSQVYYQTGVFDYNYARAVAVSHSDLVVGAPGAGSQAGAVFITGL